MARKKGEGGRLGQIRVRSFGRTPDADGPRRHTSRGWGFEVNKYKISALLFWLLLLERGEEEEELNRRRGGGGG